MTEAEIAWCIYFLVLGSGVGSFLNVCIWRMPRRCLSIFRPARSFCPSCKHKIAWYDNIPILSFVLLRARCRHCRATISWRYTVVEALTAGVFAFFYTLWVVLPVQPQWALLFVHLGYTSAIIAASFIDWEWMIIPDRISKSGMALSPLLGLAFPAIYGKALMAAPGFLFLPAALAGNLHVRGLLTAGVGMAAGAGIIYGMGVFGKILFRKEAMGFGDVKYMAMIGGILGWQGGGIAILLACVFGSVVGIIRKLITGDSYIPFGPFLGAGAVVVMARGDVFLFWLNARFGVLIRLIGQKLGHGLLLALMLMACILAIAWLVKRSRSRAAA